MTELGLRPRSATELVDAAFQVFRRNPVPFIVASAVFYVPWLVVRLAIALDMPTINGSIDWSLLLISGAFSAVVYTAASAVAMLIARDVYLDRPVDLLGAFRALVPKIPTLIVTSLITSTLIIIASMFFLLPALYVIARFFAARQTIVLENAGVGRALARSSELSVGQKRHILSTLLLAGLITLSISFGSGLVAGMIPLRVVQYALTTVSAIFVYPFLAITQTLLYYDVRIRKEGFDIEYLAEGLTLDTASDTSA